MKPLFAVSVVTFSAAPKLKMACESTSIDTGVSAFACLCTHTHTHTHTHDREIERERGKRWNACMPLTISMWRWDMAGYARTGDLTTPLGSGFYISPEILQAFQS